MKQPVRYVLRILWPLLIWWAIDGVAMLITIAVLPGVTVTSPAVERWSPPSWSPPSIFPAP